MKKLLENAGLSLLGRLDPERAGHLAVKGLEAGLVPGFHSRSGGQVRVWDLTFRNRLGVAAGFDKNGRGAHGLLRAGFGFTEVGTVTPKPQSGNDRPRVFRLRSDRAVINRLGFNNEGHDAVYDRLKARGRPEGVLGINVGANKTSDDWVEDYQAGIRKFAGVADYLVINISSPNTPGLRNLQAKDALDRLVSESLETRDQSRETVGRKVPLLLKIAPDISLSELDDIVSVATRRGLDGLIVSNTTISREGLSHPDREKAGGLSGAPLMAPSTALLSETRQRVAESLPLIGVGGVMSAADAVAKLDAGATLVQIYTGLTYGGFSLAEDIVSAFANYASGSASGAQNRS